MEPTYIWASAEKCPQCGRSDVQETHHPGEVFQWCYHCDWHQCIAEATNEEEDHG